MAKVLYSAIVSDIRNSVGDIVFSAWKGRGYVRRRVTPANPNTTAQQAQRSAMTRTVAAWQSLVLAIQSAWGRYAAGKSISGFNGWTSANVSQERTDMLTTITPPVGEIGSIAGVTFFADVSHNIEISWSVGEAANNDVVTILLRKLGTNTIVIDSDTSLVSALSAATDVLNIGDVYMASAVNHNADGKYAVSHSQKLTII